MRKIHFVSVTALAVLVPFALVGPRALADTVPAAEFSVLGEGIVGFTTQTDPGTFSASNCFAGDCQTTTHSLFYAGGTASNSMSGTDSGPADEAGGFDTVTFYFVVVGNYSGQVPVVVTATANTSASSPGSSSSGVKEYSQAYADVAAFTSGEGIGEGLAGVLHACSETIGAPLTPCTGPSSFTNSTITFDVAPNEFGNNAANVELGTSTSTNGGSFSVSIDPMVAFAPGFDSTGLSLEFSANPPSATPEPGSLVLLGTALLGLGFTLRQRQAWGTRS